MIWTFLGFGVRSAVDFSPFVVEFALITCLKQHAPFRVNCTEVSPHKLDTCPHIQLLKSASPQAALLRQRLDTTQCEYPPCVAESGEGIEFSPHLSLNAMPAYFATQQLLSCFSNPAVSTLFSHSYAWCQRHSCCQISISPLRKSHSVSLMLRCWNTV